MKRRRCWVCTCRLAWNRNFYACKECTVVLRRMSEVHGEQHLTPHHAKPPGTRERIDLYTARAAQGLPLFVEAKTGKAA